MLKRSKIEVTGTVQGVGFRPFIFRIASQYQLSGWVINYSLGVSIEVQGHERNVNAFSQAMTEQAPPLSYITHITFTPLSLLTEEEIQKEYQSQFSIRESVAPQESGVTANIAPDFTLCHDCFNDIHSPESRYYRYPLTSCTNCGPRYSIIHTLPYDRKSTSMSEFEMCPNCMEAYQTPSDRRYHAQPISCPDCGPQITWIAAKQEHSQASVHSDEVLKQAANAINSGAIVAIKGIGGFHLLCDATNHTVVTQLRHLKQRPKKPLAIMVKEKKQAEHYIVAEELEWQLLESQQRPITLLKKRKEPSDIAKNSHLAKNIAENIPYLGVMLPYTPLYSLLFDFVSSPLVVTSANHSGQPIITEGKAILAAFGESIAGIIDHPRNILNPCDDSVVQLAGGQRQVLRLARGYAPYHFALPSTLKHPIIAVGAQQKTNISLGIKDKAVVHPYIGDLKNLEMLSLFEKNTQQVKHLYHIENEAYVNDLHPSYSTVEWVKRETKKEYQALNKVQHHYAHVLSVMAEYHLSKPVLGFSFDGTGLGDNGDLWGGEVLLADSQHYQRQYTLTPFRLIGGEQAITSPPRLLLGLLLEYYSFEQIIDFQLPIFAAIPINILNNYHKIWLRGVNSPYTSSVGRLIDAYCALLGGVPHINYEGECGLYLEQLATNTDNPLDKGIESETLFQINEKRFSFQPLIEYALDRLTQSKQAPNIDDLALLFFQQCANLISEISIRETENRPLPIILSGGVFQNRVLMDAIKLKFSSQGMHFLASQTLPLNDGGISAGQLWYYAHQ